MAINPQFLSVNGFNGVSCQPDSPPSKASLSFNVDTSRGTIRHREGFVTVKRFYPSVASGTPTKAIAVRTLGIKSFSSPDGVGLVMVFLWDENTQEILFAVIDHQGSVIDSSMPYSVSAFPYSVTPGPFNFPVFAEMHSTVFVSFPSGQVFQYNYRRNKTALVAAVVGNIGAKKDVFPYLEEVPDATVIATAASRMVYSGFEGNETFSCSINLPENQDQIPSDFVAATRAGGTMPRSAIYFSDPGDPTAVKADRFVALDTGETVTGLLGQGVGLYAFTMSSVYYGAFSQQSGRPESMGRIARGIGCVSPRCIVQGRGVTLFLSVDGIYALSGQSVQKISVDLDDMFTEEGWSLGPMYTLSASDMIDVPYPFKVLKSQLKFACGGYDAVRNLFWWSLPVAGTHLDDVYSDNASHGNVQEMLARVCVVFDPERNAWNLWGASKGSSLVPTCFDTAYDGATTRFLFGDEFSGVNAYGEDSSDKLSSSAGGRTAATNDTPVEFTWFWQSQHLDAGASVSASVRSIRVKQKARGGGLSASQKTEWHLETEFSFDQENGELSFRGNISPNPSELYPKQKTPTHTWGNDSTWGSVRWHKRETWKARYSVNNNIVGRSFRVGFAGTGMSSRGMSEDLYDFDLELQPKRDIT